MGCHMAKIKYIEANGTEHVVDAQPGMSVMEAAVKNDVPGILGECGGNCACGTCRVYIDAPSWRDKTGTRSNLEQDMLDFHDDREAHARLGCQIKITAALDGLVVRMPSSQHSAYEVAPASISAAPAPAEK
jgi:2Fe-2S ferredoxin